MSWFSPHPKPESEDSIRKPAKGSLRWVLRHEDPSREDPNRVNEQCEYAEDDVLGLLVTR